MKYADIDEDTRAELAWVDRMARLYQCKECLQSVNGHGEGHADGCPDAPSGEDE